MSSATGGAGLAANDEGEQNFLNPATLVHLKSLAVGYFYSDGYRGKDEHDKWYGFTISDNSPDVAFAGAITYVERKRTFPAFYSLKERFLEVSFAGPIIKHLSWGASIFHLNQAALSDKTYKQTDGKIGLFYNPTPDLGLAAVALNVGPTHDEVLEPLQLKDEFGLGVNYIFMRQFRGRLDVYRQTQMNPNGDFRWGVGFESLLDAFFVARFGYQADDLADRKYYTLGFGFTGPRLKMDYSYVKNVDDNRGGMHSVDFRMPL